MKTYGVLDTSEVLTLETGDVFVSRQSGITLKVVGWTEDFEFGTRLTHCSTDGQRWSTEWHTGDESDDSVWVERWGLGGCEFHGCVDSVSRKITQVG